MSVIYIKKDICNGCEICIPSCPFGAIEMQEGVAIITEACTLCGACLEVVCPLVAIVKEEIPKAEEISEAKRMQIDVTTYSGVWVFAEQRKGILQSVTFELIGEGQKLAKTLGEELAAVLLGYQMDSCAEELRYYNLDKIYVVDSPELEHFQDDSYSKSLAQLAKKYKPGIILCGATNIGRSFIPQVAIKLSTGLTADCTGLSIEDTTRDLLQTRPAFGGNIFATIVTRRHRPQIATVRHKVMKQASRSSVKSGEIIKESLPIEFIKNRTKFIKSIEDLEETVNLAEADIIVSGGRGLGDPKYFSLVEDLAKAIRGAVGASRAAVDAGWISYAHQVGQTGKTVCPKVYVACGISGAIQHLVGMQSSEIIIAINKDPDAPIFKIATYGVVGNLHEILPALTKRILSH